LEADITNLRIEIAADSMVTQHGTLAVFDRNILGSIKCSQYQSVAAILCGFKVAQRASSCGGMQ